MYLIIYRDYIEMELQEQDLIKRLNTVNPKDVKKFSFDGIVTYARVIKVYDADTITILFEYNGNIVKYNIRISGIDAPELKSKMDKEKELSKQGQKYVSDLILNTIIKVKFGDFDKYGRIIGEVMILTSPRSKNFKEMNLSELLIEGGYVREYDGGHKQEWDL